MEIETYISIGIVVFILIIAIFFADERFLRKSTDSFIPLFIAACIISVFWIATIPTISLIFLAANGVRLLSSKES